MSVPVILEYNVTIPVGSDTTYSLHVTPTASRAKVCTIYIGYQGVNMPCLNLPSMPIYSPDGSALWSLGRVRNGGQRSVSIDPQANTLQFIIVVLPLNVSANSIGSQDTITTKMAYGTSENSLSTTVQLVANRVTLTVRLISTYLFILNCYIIADFSVDCHSVRKTR